MLTLQYLLYGLSTGALYALLACGLVVAYRASGYLNFAHPYVGMVATLGFVLLVPSVGVVPAFVLALALGAILSAALYAGLFARLAEGPLGPKVVMSLAVGLSLQVVGGLLFIRYGDELLGGGSKRSFLPQHQVEWLPDSLALTVQQLGLPIAALLALFGLVHLFQRTDFGLALRACAQNPLSALLAGLPRRTVELTAWAIGGALAAAAGVLALSSQSFLVPTYLFEEGIRGFVAALAGGFTDLRRAVAAAFVLGVVEQQLIGAGGGLADVAGATTFVLLLVIALSGLPSRGLAALERAE
ncbi:MAG: branched-chain amino acid ABC transporter permease [Actinomycetota bacterium]|nr:branched-chain amino acid ABC transporter permease [Actinomycetota bacterium]